MFIIIDPVEILVITPKHYQTRTAYVEQLLNGPRIDIRVPEDEIHRIATPVDRHVIAGTKNCYLIDVLRIGDVLQRELVIAVEEIGILKTEPETEAPGAKRKNLEEELQRPAFLRLRPNKLRS